MDFLKRPILRVPLVCAGGGILCRFLNFVIVFTMTRIRIAMDPTAPLSVSEGVTTVMAILAFVVFFAAGWRFLRGLTRREIFLSATVMVVFQLLVLAWEQIAQAGGEYSTAVYYLWALTESQGWASQLLFRITGQVTVTQAAIAQFTPLLYIFFGRKRAEKKELI